MLILPIEEARPGMKLAAPVTHPDNPNQDLLRQGYLLEPTVIARLRAIEVPFIYVDYPGMEALDRHLAVYLSPARQAVYSQIKKSIAQVQKSTRPALSYDAYCSSTRELVTTLLTQGQNPVYLEQMSRQGADAVGHAAAVAHLSLLIGLKLDAYLISQRSRLPPALAKDVINLGVGAMLHDIGVSKLPEALQKFSELEPPQDDAQYKEWASHAQLGYEMLRNSVPATAAVAVYQHHQHFDGAGFPTLKGSDDRAFTLEGQRIHVFSRIILCANLYDRLATPVSGRPRRSNAEVLLKFRTEFFQWYDPEVFRVLQMIVPPYPPGSRLKLTDGSDVIVTDIHPQTPDKPIVRKLAPDGWTLTPEILDLRLPDAPRIASTAEGEPAPAPAPLPSPACAA